MNVLSLSWRLTRRDWRAGELGLLVAALIIAVASICSVGFFVDRMRQALSLQARQLLGADLLIASDRPIASDWDGQAEQRGLRHARTVNFPSMASAGGMPQLTAIKAVSQGYPLRGVLRVATGLNRADEATADLPSPGTIWADGQLLKALDASVGDQVELGQSRFRIERVLTLEPDRGANFVNFAPRALMRLQDLAATGLVQPASRVTYRLLVSGPAASVASFEAWARNSLARGMRIESLETGRPELRNTLDRAEQFLSLVAMLSALIAAVAIGLAARRFAERHLDGCAVMRAIGIGQRQLISVLGLELFWVALFAGALGVSLGWFVHLALEQVLAPLIGLPLPPPGIAPVLQGLATGLVLLLGFGAWPFLRLAGVPAMRVLRRELGAAQASPWLAFALALGSFVGLLVWFCSDLRLAAIAIGGFAAGTVVFMLLTFALMRLVTWARRSSASFLSSPAIRMALASWSRRQSSSIVQTVALAIGLM
ncbi:MAG: FtsX-like permease family protein, partial [Quisquiliibacterium sp.]